MLVPLLVNRPVRGTSARTVDVMPSALAALGKADSARPRRRFISLMDTGDDDVSGAASCSPLAWRGRSKSADRRGAACASGGASGRAGGIAGFPFLPLPARDYLRWRMYTAYGDEDVVPPADDIVRYARWAVREP